MFVYSLFITGHTSIATLKSVSTYFCSHIGPHSIAAVKEVITQQCFRGAQVYTIQQRRTAPNKPATWPEKDTQASKFQTEKPCVKTRSRVGPCCWVGSLLSKVFGFADIKLTRC